MRQAALPTIFGTVLIVIGILFLLDTLGAIPLGDVVWPALFALGGLAFLYAFFVDRSANWWAVIPALTLLGLASLIAWEVFAPKNLEAVGPALFLVAISASFWIVYAHNHAYWWAIIPGGVLASVAALVGLSAFLPQGSGLVGIFFIGLGLTFALLWLLPVPQGRQRWALIPASILGAFGLVFVLTGVAAAAYVWPIVLIAAGLFLILRITLSRPRSS